MAVAPCSSTRCGEDVGLSGRCGELLAAAQRVAAVCYGSIWYSRAAHVSLRVQWATAAVMRFRDHVAGMLCSRAPVEQYTWAGASKQHTTPHVVQSERLSMVPLVFSTARGHVPTTSPRGRSGALHCRGTPALVSAQCTAVGSARSAA